MGKHHFLILWALWSLAPLSVQAQHKLRLCTSSGCTCYETWSPVWDQAYQDCMGQRAEERMGRQASGAEYTSDTNHCSSQASSIHKQQVQSMGNPDRLESVRSYSCEAPADPEKRETTGALPEKQEGYVPNPCIKKVEEAGRACQQAQSQATQSCDPAQYPALQQSDRSGQSLSSDLNGQKNTNHACGQAAGYGTGFQSALASYVQGCESGRAACESSCAAAQREAQACQSQTIQGVVQEIAGNVQTCSSAGPLAARAREASQQRQEQAAATADAQNCEMKSASSESPSTSSKTGPLAQNSDSGGGSPPAGGSSRGSPPVGRETFLTEGRGTGASLGGAGSGGRASEDIDVSGQIPLSRETSSASVGASGGQLFDLPPSPAATEFANKEEESFLSASPGGGTYGGGKGRGSPLRPLRRPLRAGGEDSDQPVREAASEEVPDLNAFRPRMAGLGTLPPCSDLAKSPWKKNPQGCLHGAHQDLWSLIRNRYEQLSPSLINDLD